MGLVACGAKKENDIADAILRCAFKVHSSLGPGLLEKTYEACLAHEIARGGLSCERQIAFPLIYDGIEIDEAYRVDLLVERRVVIEVKAVERLLKVHRAQLLSYLRAGDFRLGYVLNFHVAHMKEGICRLANKLSS